LARATRTRLRLRPWRAGDEDAFEPRADFAEEAAISPFRPDPNSRAWTLCRAEDEIIGIAWAIECEPGAFSVGARLAAVARRDWPGLVWLADRVCVFLEDDCQASMILASARLELPGAVATLKRIGFVDNGRFELPGATYVAMSRTA
jgi:hypothetical protein